MSQWHLRRLKNTSVGQRLKEPARSAFQRLGYDLVPLERDETHVTRYLLEHFAIQQLVDVGANQGQFAKRMRGLGFRGEIISFEPGAEAFALLARRVRSDAAWTAHKLAVGSVPGVRTLQVSENSVSSSLLDVREVHLAAEEASRAAHVEPVKVVRLDDALGISPARTDAQPLSRWLKVDTQGYEAEVLAGAPELLSQATVVQLELSFAELYAEQADFFDLLLTLRRAGLEIFDMVPGFREPRTGRLLQSDVIAVRQ